ncbi:hypothetical protein AVEN_233073-1 [Araneus ventricosus]|uniref:Uncharacterized protein n=1 Tax=Araneus ventricosus TaxID=182803 RepID=A0A4Y2PC31_ARAVE|nr:hypothetical protein AVEN_233073-1 [Araneus ventricosus]
MITALPTLVEAPHSPNLRDTSSVGRLISTDLNIDLVRLQSVSSMDLEASKLQAKILTLGHHARSGSLQLRTAYLSLVWNSSVLVHNSSI